MFITQDDPYRRALSDSLVLRTVESLDDVQRLAEFNGTIHGDGVRTMTELLIKDHPNTHPRHWLMVWNTDSDEVVASLCLIPWIFLYSGVELRSAEVGIVGTLESYRKKGLQRELMMRHRALVDEEGFHLSHIQGIGYFYRQFGYEYAVPLEAHINLELRSAKAAAETAKEQHGNPYAIRGATETDIPDLIRFYGESAKKLDLSVVRDENIWRYILGSSLATGVAADTYVIEENGDQAVGYMRIAREGFGTGLIVQECTDLPEAAYPRLAEFIVRQAETLDKPYIRFNLNPTMGAARWALENGGVDQGHYRWQMRIPSVLLLEQIIPVLNQRLAISDFKGYTGKISLDLYRECMTVSIANGAVNDIIPKKVEEGLVVRMPPNLLPVCVLGDRTLRECMEFYPDASSSPRATALFDTLFPKMNSFLLEEY